MGMGATTALGYQLLSFVGLSIDKRNEIIQSHIDETGGKRLLVE